MRRSGFSLIELLVATALSAMLMAAVLAILAGVSRDRKRLTAAQNLPSPQAMINRFQWDLTNAQTLSQSPDGHSLELIGHCAIDYKTLAPNGRLVTVDYRLYQDGDTSCLVREQKYLDDPAAPSPWRELISIGVTNFRVIARSTDELTANQQEPSTGLILASDLRPKAPVIHVPERVRLQITMPTGMVDRELWVR
jgi:prepilin-type N-terminal cleavage/methylation domain-containing protein